MDNEKQPNVIDELQKFLEELESLAPKREDVSGSKIGYRAVIGEEMINDSLPEESVVDIDGLEAEESGRVISIEELPQASDFQITQPGPIAAVDCGIVRLGETENGLVITMRAAIVVEDGEKSGVSIFRTGPIYLHNHYKLKVLHRIGAHLGKPDFFVEMDITDVNNPKPIRVKRGVADDAHQYGDRFRNWLERLTQRIAVTFVENGTILLDGALTLRTRDTPNSYYDELARLAGMKGNSIIAISKQSMLQVNGKPVRFWLNDLPNRVCYRSLSPMMRKEGIERVYGNAYASRFSLLGPTFRMDVKPVDGQTDDEAINRFYSSSLMRGGYPDILVRSHTYSYFTSPDVIQLQAQAGAKYRLVPQPEIDLSGIFAPFGGRFK